MGLCGSKHKKKCYNYVSCRQYVDPGSSSYYCDQCYDRNKSTFKPIQPVQPYYNTSNMNKSNHGSALIQGQRNLYPSQNTRSTNNQRRNIGSSLGSSLPKTALVLGALSLGQGRGGYKDKDDDDDYTQTYHSSTTNHSGCYNTPSSYDHKSSGFGGSCHDYKSSYDGYGGSSSYDYGGSSSYDYGGSSSYDYGCSSSYDYGCSSSYDYGVINDEY